MQEPELFEDYTARLAQQKEAQPMGLSAPDKPGVKTHDNHLHIDVEPWRERRDR